MLTNDYTNVINNLSINDKSKGQTDLTTNANNKQTKLGGIKQ